MAESSESISYDLNTKWSIWSMQMKTEKPKAFWNNVLWTDETKMKLFGHH